MRVAHKNVNTKDSPGSWLDKAKEFEQQNELEKAAAAYEKVIGEHPLNEYAYDRLMIIYRKNKEYKKEKVVINKAIKAFEQFYKKASKPSSSKKIVSLSKVFMKSTGLADKKGKLLYQKEPLAKWNKRKTVVEKRLKV
jgi:tetratricopeptide (TPR) repeat protein